MHPLNKCDAMGKGVLFPSHDRMLTKDTEREIVSIREHAGGLESNYREEIARRHKAENKTRHYVQQAGKILDPN
jgi:hypothetical protein